MKQLSEVSPYPGLRRFERSDAKCFFGRDDNVFALVSRIVSSRFIALIGESGCGKSSVVRAGMIPSLKTEKLESGEAAWRVAVMQPSAYPIESLRCALWEKQALAGVASLDEMLFVADSLRAGRLGLATSRHATFRRMQSFLSS